MAASFSDAGHHWTEETRSTSDPTLPLPIRTRPAQEDANNPYFMGTRDNPGLILASPPLTDTNFQQWARDFKLFVDAKNKNENKSSINYLDSAAAMWTELNKRFNQGNGPCIFDIQTSLISLHQGDDSISAYFSKLNEIWDEINGVRPRTPCTCDVSNDSLELQNLEQVLRFLTGLNESYHAVHSQVLLIDSLLFISKVFSTIMQEERQRKIKPSATTSLIVASTSTTQSSNPPSLLQSRTKKMQPTCSHYQKPGHLKEKFYFIHGLPPGYGTRNVNNKPTI
ncbi:uncharacterized protein LOC133796178 [Humulus lupulus]|uniref:uncharacterized protein LOC133796178 n=1 Tax=Humulus lupulus TaxID=3486 RepID=UPI002B40DE2E|nr:uncharacterized protein LOC133796178 [Humulus lupulus]